MNLLSQFEGQRTYITVGIITVLLLLHWKNWLVLPPEVYALMFGAAIAFLRSAVARAEASVNDAHDAIASLSPARTPSPRSPFLPLVLAGLVAAVLVGCANPKMVAYKSLAAVGQTEAAAMKSAAALRAEGQLLPDAWSQIAAAHDKFAPAYGAAVDLARMDYTQPASATVIALAQEVINLVAAYTPQGPADKP